VIKEYPEKHQQGTMSLENINTVGFGIKEVDKQVIKGDFGIHIAKDGRVWVCIDGIAFLRFSPHRDGKMKKRP